MRAVVETRPEPGAIEPREMPKPRIEPTEVLVEIKASRSESGRVDIKPLITHKFKIEDCAAAFKTLLDREGMKELIVP